MPNKPTIRTETEVQRAHDILVGIILDEVPIEMRATEEDKMKLSQYACILCWMLHHDHNTAFAKLLADLEKIANQLGFVIEGPSEN